jgi:hypothetical protein
MCIYVCVCVHLCVRVCTNDGERKITLFDPLLYAGKCQGVGEYVCGSVSL